MVNQNESIQKGRSQLMRIMVNKEGHNQSIMTQGLSVTIDHDCSVPFHATIFWNKLHIEVSISVKIHFRFLFLSFYKLEGILRAFES